MTAVMPERVVTLSSEPDRITLTSLVLDELGSDELQLALFVGGPVPRESRYWSLARIVAQAVDGLVAEGVEPLRARSARASEMMRRSMLPAPEGGLRWRGAGMRERGYGEGIFSRLQRLSTIVWHERCHDQRVAGMGWTDGLCRALWCERCRPAEHIATWHAGGDGARALAKSWGTAVSERTWSASRPAGAA